jgi:GNAT superfamily N-acetyltransferase
MEELQLVYEQFPERALANLVERRLISHAVAATNMTEGFPLGYLLKNARGEWLGGVVGFAWGDWLYVRLLWVAADYRAQGYGTRLMDAAEQFAIGHGCRHATLETFSYQAPAFYLKRGYEIFGQLDGYPPGHTKFYLRKTLRKEA